MTKDKKNATSQVVGPYLQTLTLDDQTGALLAYQDKVAGGVTVAYRNSCVNTADYGLR